MVTIKKDEKITCKFEDHNGAFVADCYTGMEGNKPLFPGIEFRAIDRIDATWSYAGLFRNSIQAFLNADHECKLGQLPMGNTVTELHCWKKV